MSALRVVLDTNVVLSALLFSKGKLEWLRVAWQTSRIIPLASKPVAANVAALVTGDDDLLALQGRCAVSILAPADFRKKFNLAGA